jgi:PAS domain S-box-containing protein
MSSRYETNKAMSRKRRRAGIETKILKSILWVGICPMAVAAAVGGLAAWKVGIPEEAGTVVAVSLLMGSVLVGFFCLVEYRRVHNDIVRPVRLLNEGTRIVGHGDLELKLKVATGDEIEELAASFNRMALDLKRKIRQLEESEEKYRGVVTSMKEGIYRTNAAGEISFLNKAAAQIFGYSNPDEALGINMKTLYVEEIDAARMDSELRARGYVDRFRFWVTRKDGDAICVEASSNLIKDEAGNLVAAEGMFRDVTEQMRLEGETKEKAGRLAVINEITNAINSSLDADRVYETIAVKVRKLVQFDCAGIALQSDITDSMEVFGLWPLSNEDQAAAVQYTADDKSGLHWVMENARPLVVESEQEVSDLSDMSRILGDEVRSCVYMPLFSKERLTGAFVLGRKSDEVFGRYELEVLEQIAGHIGVAVENARLFKNLVKSFEEVKEAQEKLATAHEELKTFDQMKTNLLSNVSHELRTPLVSIMGYTDMILREKVGGLNKTQKEYLAISLRNVEKLVTLIENLLDFSRLHRGTENPVFGIVDLVELAKSSVQVIRPVADRRNISVEIKAPPEGLVVEGDKEKIGQVFDNLLSNAAKFNSNDGSIVVELRTDSANNAEVSVRDTGIGIPREALDKVFTRFYQFDSSSTRKYGGTGIGLSIAQDIVRMHGGRLSVTSEVGEGSTFTFTVPLVLRDEQLEEVRRRSLPETRGLVELVTKDRELAENVKVQLNSEGINVMHVTGRDEAVRLAGKHLPDCIAIDAGIDGHGGRTVAERLKHDAYSSRIPIVLIAEDGHDSECPEAWITARVSRAYRKGRLVSTVNYVMGLSGRESPPEGDKILVVDDDPDVTVFLSNVLGGEGYEVVCAGSGQEALDKIKDGGIGLVLLDIAMPEMDGWEVCRRIRSEPEYGNAYIYIVTAKPEASISRRIASSGADGYLIKPFRTEDIMAKVNEAVHPTQKLPT